MHRPLPAQWTRRDILRGGVAFAGGALVSGWTTPTARGAGSGNGNDVLVYLLLRGGIDGLSVCVPYGDAQLYAARPKLAVAPPGSPDGALDLDGFYGLNPAAAPLQNAYHQGHLALVHAMGSPDPTRSHFQAFHKMDYGIPNQPATAASEGWLARHLQAKPPAANGPLRCALLGEVMPLSLAGAPKTLPVSDPEQLAFPGSPVTADPREAALRSMYGAVPAPLGPAAIHTMDTLDLLASQTFPPVENGAVYPDTQLGAKLRSAAALIQLDLGIEVILLDQDGFDHHTSQGPIDGDLALLLDDLSQSLAAFHQDLTTHWSRVTLVAHSEFGRRVAENAGKGTDHGHGGLAIVMGGHVNGAKVHGTWPGLIPSQLVEGDLAITTDYRDLMGEILAKRLGAPDLAYVFPNHQVTFPGVVT